MGVAVVLHLLTLIGPEDNQSVSSATDDTSTSSSPDWCQRVSEASRSLTKLRSRVAVLVSFDM